MAEQRRRRREGSQRAQASRERRQDARSRKRTRNRLYALAGGVALVAAVILVVLLQGGGSDLGRTIPQLRGVHSPPYVYNSDPPTSGNHLAIQSPSGHLGAPLVKEAVVHNMEHGSVVLWYQPDDPELAGDVNRLVRDLGDTCLVAGTYGDMDFTMVATVWGRTLELDRFDEILLREFIEAYRGELGPEAGLCRQGG